MTDPCIDAEVLAAWVDDTLDARAAADVEHHAAHCARCQAMLAAFVRAEPAPTRVAALEPVVAPWWQSLQIRWLVPIAATATALAIWIAVPTSPRPEGELATATDASATAPPEQSPAAPLTATKPSSTPAPVRANDQDAAPAAKEIPIEAPAARQEAMPDATGQRERVDTLAAAERRAAEAAPAPPGPGARNRSEAALRSSLADTVAVGFVSRDGAVRWRLAGPGVEQSADGGATWTASALNGLQELDERRPAAPQGGAAAMTAAPATAAQAPRPGAVAGDAPTASVCWLVGPRGAVWLTTDGGQRFRQMTVTGEPDSRMVAARDARSADVSTVDGRTFRTDDGGSTWTLTSP